MDDRNDLANAADSCAKTGCALTLPISIAALVFAFRQQWILMLTCAIFGWTRRTAELYLPQSGSRRWVRYIATQVYGLVATVCVLGLLILFLRIRKLANASIFQMLGAALVGCFMADVIFVWVVPGRRRQTGQQPAHPTTDK